MPDERRAAQKEKDQPSLKTASLTMAQWEHVKAWGLVASWAEAEAKARDAKHMLVFNG
jgi:hypothetical protein